MGDVFVLIQPSRRQESETVKALEQLLAQARAGEIVGLAYTALRENRSYSVGLAGEARCDPTYTKGMLGVLDNELDRIICSPP